VGSAADGGKADVKNETFTERDCVREGRGRGRVKKRKKREVQDRSGKKGTSSFPGEIGGMKDEKRVKFHTPGGGHEVTKEATYESASQANGKTGWDGAARCEISRAKKGKRIKRRASRKVNLPSCSEDSSHGRRGFFCRRRRGS